jgi:hypothetical protein
VGGGEKVGVISIGDGREVVPEDLNRPSRVSSRLPCGEVFGIYWWEFVTLVRIAMRNALGGISYRSDERDKKSW